MKKILITGASGFIGRHCLPLLLDKGYEIHAISSKIQPESRPGIIWHHVDLLDVSQINRLIATVRPAQILHLAWYAEPCQFWNAWENLRWVQSSLSLLEAFAREGGQRIVMAGSCAEYNWKYSFLSEQHTPLSPLTLYGTCKHALQITLSSFAEQSGLSTAWGRIFFLYGPYEHPLRLTSYVIRSLLKNEPALCSHGNQIRDFLYVEDAASAFVALLESEFRGPVNIASGQPVSIKEIISKIAVHLDRLDLIRFGEISTREEPLLLLADTDRLMSKVGWRPSIDLDSGLSRTIAWWRDTFKFSQ